MKMGRQLGPYKSLGFALIGLSPAYAGLKICGGFDPGAYAPGFMLSPASQAKIALLCNAEHSEYPQCQHNRCGKDDCAAGDMRNSDTDHRIQRLRIIWGTQTGDVCRHSKRQLH